MESQNNSVKRKYESDDDNSMYTLYVQLCELRVLAFFFFELPTILKSSALIEPDWPVKSPILLHQLLRCTSVWH